VKGQKPKQDAVKGQQTVKTGSLISAQAVSKSKNDDKKTVTEVCFQTVFLFYFKFMEILFRLLQQH